MIEICHVQRDDTGDRDPGLLFCKDQVLYGNDVGKFFRIGKIKEDLEATRRIRRGKGSGTLLKDTGQEESSPFFTRRVNISPFRISCRKYFCSTER